MLTEEQLQIIERKMETWVIPMLSPIVVEEVRSLFAEIRRLKVGDFTEEELQSLCHKFKEDDACRFRKGCEEYQRKLFGNDTIDKMLLEERGRCYGSFHDRRCTLPSGHKGYCKWEERQLEFKE